MCKETSLALWNNNLTHCTQTAAIERILCIGGKEISRGRKLKKKGWRFSNETIKNFVRNFTERLIEMMCVQFILANQ